MALVVVAVVVVAGGVGGTLYALSRRSSGPPARASSNRPLPPPAPIVDRVPACSVVAALQGPTPAYEGPGALTPGGQLAPSLAGQPVTLPVIDVVRHHWLEARVMARPNGQTVWLKSSTVKMLADPYRIVVDLGHQRVFLYRDGQIVLQVPVAVGAAATPTPLGNFFVTLLAQPPSADYGPFVIVTSAYGSGVTNWDQGGQAVVALTGPLGWSSAIGSPNGAVTGGGIALRTSDLSQLRPVPLGTPVDVVASWNPPPPTGHGSGRGPTTTTRPTAMAVAPFPISAACS